MQFTSDTVIVPKETAHFGFYAENSFGPSVPVKEVQGHQRLTTCFFCLCPLSLDVGMGWDGRVLSTKRTGLG